MRVLLIDDDDALAALLTQQLTAQNYVVDRVSDGEAGWAYGSTFDYDLIIMGIDHRKGLREIEGFLFGSTAERVIRGTQIPVLCVPFLS